MTSEFSHVNNTSRLLIGLKSYYVYKGVKLFCVCAVNVIIIDYI